MWPWALFFSALAGGTACTCLVEEDDARPGARLAAGAAVGLAVLGLAGYLLAVLFGFTPASVALAGLLTLSPAAIWLRPAPRSRLLTEVEATVARWRSSLGQRPLATAARLLLCAAAVLLVWRVYDRAMYVTGEGIFTGVDHNLGDLPFHLGLASSFLEGDNIPPEHPELAGARLTYPFLVDFLTAMWMRAGASVKAALLVPNVTLGLALIALLYAWAAAFTGDRLAAALTPGLVLLDGGLGWWWLVREGGSAAGGLLALLRHLPHDYTILGSGELRWGNAVVTLLIPQRSFLFGLPLVLLVWLCWWRALSETPAAGAPDRTVRRMAGAGIVTGLLPLVHAHSFATLVAMAVCLAVLFPRLRAWGAFFAAAAVVAAPQLAWLARGSALQGGSFLAWQPGWDHDGHNIAWFWLVNTGLFIPVLVVAVVMEWIEARRAGTPSKHLRFWLPSVLWFVVPNLLRLSPWIWDNVKFLFVWYVASAPLVALALARLFRRGPVSRAAGAVLATVLMLAGALDVWRVVSGTIALLIFDSAGMAFARNVAEATPPRALVLHAPVHDSPLLLAGRRSLLGYPGHIWSQGLDGGTREADIRTIYLDGPEAPALLDRYGVDYVAVGPQERSLGARDEAWSRSYPLVAEAWPYRLYSVRTRSPAP